MPRIAVVDLSHHNTIPASLRPAREAGVRGVIHKLTEGTSFVDSKVEARRRLALDAGMLWGLYHFLRPGSMADQVDHFVGKAAGISDARTLFACDYEDPLIGLDDVAEFLARLEDRTDRAALLYSGHVLKEKLAGKPHEELAEYRLWLAQYAAKPVLPPGWSGYFLWQYSDGVSGPDPKDVPGINHPVDCNDYAGSDTELIAEWPGRADDLAPVHDGVRPDAEAPRPSPPQGGSGVPSAAQTVTITIRVTVPPGASVVIGTE